MTAPTTIVIGSAGRRVYLVRWFQEAFRKLGVSGRVVVTDLDRSSAAFAAADCGIEMPSYADEAYEDAMRDMIDRVRPQMFFSVNDYELAKLARGLGREIENRGVVIPGIAEAGFHSVSDKFEMAQLLSGAGVPTPTTVLSSDVSGVRNILQIYSQVVVKDRYGSGSSGLTIANAATVDREVRRARDSVSGRSSDNRSGDLVVQPRIVGDEYGMDIVGTLSPDVEQRFTPLVRQKLRMRGGETDKAVTVSPDGFFVLADKLGRLLDHRGLIDVDVLKGSDGLLQVIDINPRFGGGYPFVHLAGADIPLMYVASLIGLPLSRSWTDYTPGIVSSKFEEVRVTGCAS